MTDSSGERYVRYDGAAATWDASSIRGDLVLTTDSSGHQVGALRACTPYGEPLTAAGNTDKNNVPDNQPGAMDYGWLGTHQRPYVHAGGLAMVQMGARPYVPALGRFLSVDPVDGGSANDYDYFNADPVNATDTDGMRPKNGDDNGLNQQNRKGHRTGGKRKLTSDKHSKGNRRGGRRKIPVNPNKFGNPKKKGQQGSFARLHGGGLSLRNRELMRDSPPLNRGSYRSTVPRWSKPEDSGGGATPERAWPGLAYFGGWVSLPAVPPSRSARSPSSVHRHRQERHEQQ